MVIHSLHLLDAVSSEYLGISNLVSPVLDIPLHSLSLLYIRFVASAIILYLIALTLSLSPVII